ncbi:hypothetical protein ACFO3U_07710 [Flavobacterium ponti]|uniref:Uncharacterized protein n=1 Tax=Flavobacterium ponti TaxID=665133 RepID=A0ABV9P2X4_9FLAO
MVSFTQGLSSSSFSNSGQVGQGGTILIIIGLSKSVLLVVEPPVPEVCPTPV